VRDKDLVIFTRLLQPKNENDELLTPIRKLHQIVSLELSRHVPVRVIWLSTVSEEGRKKGRELADPKVFGLVPKRRQLAHDALEG
jgi:hypothetical protein